MFVVAVTLVPFVLLAVGGCNGAYLFQTSTPYVLATWEIGVNATDLAWKLLTEDGLSALDSVEKGISQTCELNYCDGVGPYETIDERGDISLDAMLMDGTTKEVGAVGNLKHVRAAISVARAVMKYTTHSFITGDDATQFAEEMGFPVEDFRTEDTEREWEEWKNNSCQPNFRRNVAPDPTVSCGPYSPADSEQLSVEQSHPISHDTLGQFIVEENQHVVVGVSTNGLTWKVPGRVGDSPMPGSGGYAWSGVGAASATGNGDVLLRFLPSMDAVRHMEKGYRPDQAAIATVLRMREVVPNDYIAVMVGNIDGQFSGACYGFSSLQIAIRSHDLEETTLIDLDCEESLVPSDNAASTNWSSNLLFLLMLIGAHV